MVKNMDQFIIIDGNSLMYRAFYALNNMTSADGTPTNAIHGFLSMLMPLIARHPEYMAVAFDVKGETFRHSLYPEYKGTRKPAPDELKTQMAIIRDILHDMGIAVCECAGYEADDILGTLSLAAEKNGIAVTLVTGDRDALQLISNTTHVLMTKKGISETIEYTKERLLLDYGLSPSQIIDLKALMGDASDNIPGISGVGEKTALRLLEKYGTAEEALNNAHNEKGALQKKLLENANSARLSHKLATIDRNIPLDTTLFDCVFDISCMEKAVPALERLQLRSILGRLKKELSKAPAPTPEPIHETPSEPQFALIDTPEKAASLFSEIELGGVFAIHMDEGFYIASSETKLYKLSDTSDEVELKSILSPLMPIFSQPDIKLLIFDAKAFMHILERWNVRLCCKLFDARIADYLLHAINPSKDLRSLLDMVGIPYNKAASLFALEPLLMESLFALNMLKLYTQIELPLVSVLFSMESAGFCTDKSILTAIGEDFGKRLHALSSRIYELAGEHFSILSTKQLGHILFEKLNLPPIKKTKTGYSTDADTLEALMDKHEIIGLISEYRFLTKLKSTYIDGMGALIGEDGRIHTSFHQTITATGRISSTEPNLQNIPVRTAEGREIRKAFIASPGNVLVGADYSQIELRVLSHISGDVRMQTAFINKADIHRSTAAEVFNIAPEDVTADQRSAAKAVNFGIVYGISDFGLAKNLGITRKRASEYINMYLSRYDGVAKYMKSSVEEARKAGFAKTIFSRRRAMPELKSSNANVRSSGERIAMNMPIQGSAADIIKLAMVNVDRELKKRELRAKLILQVHDELIIDCPEDEAAEVSDILTDCMENALTLSVPLIAEVHTGKSWFDTK